MLQRAYTHDDEQGLVLWHGRFSQYVVSSLLRNMSSNEQITVNKSEFGDFEVISRSRNGKLSKRQSSRTAIAVSLDRHATETVAFYGVNDDDVWDRFLEWLSSYKITMFWTGQTHHNERQWFYSYSDGTNVPVEMDISWLKVSGNFSTPEEIQMRQGLPLKMGWYALIADESLYGRLHYLPDKSSFFSHIKQQIEPIRYIHQEGAVGLVVEIRWNKSYDHYFSYRDEFGEDVVFRVRVYQKDDNSREVIFVSQCADDDQIPLKYESTIIYDVELVFRTVASALEIERRARIITYCPFETDNDEWDYINSPFMAAYLLLDQVGDIVECVTEDLCKMDVVKLFEQLPEDLAAELG